MANSVIFVALIYSTNSKDWKHPTDGYTVSNIQIAIEDNFYNKFINFRPCQDWGEMRYYSGGEFVKTISKKTSQTEAVLLISQEE